jgi:hypothetical protein
MGTVDSKTNTLIVENEKFKFTSQIFSYANNYQSITLRKNRFFFSFLLFTENL